MGYGLVGRGCDKSVESCDSFNRESMLSMSGLLRVQGAVEVVALFFEHNAVHARGKCTLVGIGYAISGVVTSQVAMFVLLLMGCYLVFA